MAAAFLPCRNDDSVVKRARDRDALSLLDEADARGWSSTVSERGLTLRRRWGPAPTPLLGVVAGSPPLQRSTAATVKRRQRSFRSEQAPRLRRQRWLVPSASPGSASLICPLSMLRRWERPSWTLPSPSCLLELSSWRTDTTTSSPPPPQLSAAALVKRRPHRMRLELKPPPRRRPWLIHYSLTCAWHSDWFRLTHRRHVRTHSSKVPSSNPNPRSCSCKVRSLFVFLLVTSFLSLCLVGYENHVWFLNRTMVLVLIHPWLPYDVCSSAPKVARSVVTCILLVNSQA
jgi:hypothetical protein